MRYDNDAYLLGLHALVGELGVQDKVHFLGQRPDVPEIVQELDLSLLPSWDEPFANVMLESMSMRTPLFVSEVGGGPELVEDGVSGRLLPPKDPQAWASAIADLLTDREALARMGTAAREATFRFNDETHTRAMLEVYEHVLANPERGPEAIAAALHPHPRARRCASRGRDASRARAIGRRATRSRLAPRHLPPLTRASGAPAVRADRHEDPVREPHQRVERRRGGARCGSPTSCGANTRSPWRARRAARWPTPWTPRTSPAWRSPRST